MSATSRESTGQDRISRSLGQDQGQRNKKGRKSLFPRCNTLIGSDFGYVKHRSVKFAYSMGFLAMADRVV